MVEQLAAQIAAAFPVGKPFNVVGIRTRGEILAERIVRYLSDHGIKPAGRGVLDITLYRDDLSEIGPRPVIKPTHLDISIDNLPLLLIDDVIFTGRSVRGALNLLADFGRPSVIRLAALVDRKGREVPIQPDFVGLTLAAVPPDHRVNVRLRESDGKDEISVRPKG